MTARRPGSRHAGFTLVELLLAVTLMSLLLGLAYGGLRAATGASERGQDLLEDSSRLRITHQFVRRQLNLMLPLAYATGGETQNGQEERFVFEGNATAVQFVGPMPGYLGNGGPQVQRIEIVNADDGLNLVFSHAMLVGFEPDRLLDREPVLLLGEIEDARFEFLEADELGVPTGWVSSWEEPTELPLGVRLDVLLAGERRVLWPTLAAAPRLDPTAVARAAGARDYSEAIRELIQRRRGGDE